MSAGVRGSSRGGTRCTELAQSIPRDPAPGFSWEREAHSVWRVRWANAEREIPPGRLLAAPYRLRGGV